MAPCKVLPEEAKQMRDMRRVQGWKTRDIAKRYGISDATVYEHVRALEAKMGLKRARVRRKYTHAQIEYPRQFLTERDLEKRRRNRRAQHERDPDVLRYRQEKARRAGT